MIRLTRADFKVPALLVALSVVPVLGGLARLRSLSAGVAVGADDFELPMGAFHASERDSSRLPCQS